MKNIQDGINILNLSRDVQCKQDPTYFNAFTVQAKLCVCSYTLQKVFEEKLCVMVPTSFSQETTFNQLLLVSVLA